MTVTRPRIRNSCSDLSTSMCIGTGSAAVALYPCLQHLPCRGLRPAVCSLYQSCRVFFSVSEQVLRAATAAHCVVLRAPVSPLLTEPRTRHPQNLSTPPGRAEEGESHRGALKSPELLSKVPPVIPTYCMWTGPV